MGSILLPSEEKTDAAEPGETDRRQRRQGRDVLRNGWDVLRNHRSHEEVDRDEEEERKHNEQSDNLHDGQCLRTNVSFALLACLRCLLTCRKLFDDGLVSSSIAWLQS